MRVVAATDPFNQMNSIAAVEHEPTATAKGSHYHLKAGDLDPELNKTIEEVVLCTEDFIVYIDTELAVQWRTADQHEAPEYCGEVLNVVAMLEAQSGFISDPATLRVIRRRIGEGLARCFSGNPKKNSLAALSDVELDLKARNKEISWKWYFLSAMRLTSGLVLCFAILWLMRDYVKAHTGKVAFEVTLGVLCGGLGALLSVISRSNRIIMDANAGKPLHELEGLSRIGAGLIGALLVALSIKAGLILGGTHFSGSSFALLLACCMVAGASERLVPSLVVSFERISAPEKRGHRSDETS